MSGHCRDVQLNVPTNRAYKFPAANRPANLCPLLSGCEQYTKDNDRNDSCANQQGNNFKAHRFRMGQIRAKPENYGHADGDLPAVSNYEIIPKLKETDNVLHLTASNAALDFGTQYLRKIRVSSNVTTIQAARTPSNAQSSPGHSRLWPD
jgi:hypothetical protein